LKHKNYVAGVSIVTAVPLQQTMSGLASSSLVRSGRSATAYGRTRLNLRRMRSRTLKSPPIWVWLESINLPDLPLY